eukprot:7388734-Prymnesium_polylepis.1
MEAQVRVDKRGRRRHRLRRPLEALDLHMRLHLHLEPLLDGRAAALPLRGEKVLGLAQALVLLREELLTNILEAAHDLRHKEPRLLAR